MTATAPTPAAERIYLLGGYYFEADPFDSANMLLSNPDGDKWWFWGAAEARAFAAAMTTPPQGRPSREAVARAMVVQRGSLAIWEEMPFLHRQSWLETADAVLALFPSSPQPATADTETQP